MSDEPDPTPPHLEPLDYERPKRNQRRLAEFIGGILAGVAFMVVLGAVSIVGSSSLTWPTRRHWALGFAALCAAIAVVAVFVIAPSARRSSTLAGFCVGVAAMALCEGLCFALVV